MIRLKRDGAAPLEFDGEQIAAADTKWPAGQEQNRWHELALYRTTGGRYVVGVAYRTQWQGEADIHWAAAADEPADVVTLLQEAEGEVIPADRIGYPPGAQFAEKQARMLASLRGRYDQAMGAVLHQAGITERVE